MELNSLRKAQQIKKEEFDKMAAARDKATRIRNLHNNIRAQKYSLERSVASYNSQQEYIQRAIAKNESMIKKLQTDRVAYQKAERELAKQLELIDNDKFNFLWVTEFPLLEWDEDENRYTAMHHPFTMPMDEDLELLDTDPGKVRAKAYDIVLNGTELGGGSVRIFQSDVQEKMFECLGFSKEDAYNRFGFLLNAFKYGVPPHAGLAYGLDRLVMLLVKADSIREVIAFPKVKDASCLMTNAPDIVDDKQLEEWYDKIFNAILSVIIICEHISTQREVAYQKSAHNWRR